VTWVGKFCLKESLNQSHSPSHHYSFTLHHHHDSTSHSTTAITIIFHLLTQSKGQASIWQQRYKYAASTASFPGERHQNQIPYFAHPPFLFHVSGEGRKRVNRKGVKLRILNTRLCSGGSHKSIHGVRIQFGGR
ncbi:unnamed protein product, partial [Linum tenue]